jgi:hypothetical protein
MLLGQSRTARSSQFEMEAVLIRLRQVAANANHHPARRLRHILPAILVVSAVLAFGASPALYGKKGSKVPVLGKLASGVSYQAFSGKVESLDKGRELLRVNTVQGDHTEIFQVKKDVSVYTAGGDRLKLSDLEPGSNVLIYFQLKNERRTVKEIVVLTNAPAEEKKSPPKS